MPRRETARRTLPSPRAERREVRSETRRALEEIRNKNREKRLHKAVVNAERALLGALNKYELSKRITGRLPRAEADRSYWGRSLDLDRIEQALRHVQSGRMREITDMNRETLMLDGHLSGLVQKRINRASVFDWEVVENSGEGIDGFNHELARELAVHVRSQLMNLKGFRRARRGLNWGVWDGRSLYEKEWAIVPGPSLGLRRPEGFKLAGLHWVHSRRLGFNKQRELLIVDGYQGGGFDAMPTSSFRVADAPGKFISNLPQLFNDYAELEGLHLRTLYWSFFGRLGVRWRNELLEMFGRPWRWAYSEGDRPAGTDALKEAFEVLQGMSAQQAAWLAPGVKADFYQPDAGSGQNHKDAIELAQLVESKLVLGSTGTTDAVSTGLGSSIGDAHLSEEDLVIAADVMDEDEQIEQQLSDEIVLLNYGEEALPYAPIFRSKLEALVDRDKETERIGKAVRSGLRVPLEQAYEKAGYRAPDEDEEYLAMVQEEPIPGYPAAEPRIVIVYPKGKAPPPGDLALEPVVPLPSQPGGTGAPGQPPAPTVEIQPPGTPTPPAELPPAPGGGASDPAIVRPAFASPSGLSDDDRE